MLRNETERLLVVGVLASNGFSRGWELQLHDGGEDVFFVKSGEFRRVDSIEVTKLLMAQLPGRKVALAPFKGKYPATRIF